MNKLYFALLFVVVGILQGQGQQDCCFAFALQDPSPVTIPSNSGNGMFDPVSSCSCLASNEHDSYWFAFECTASGTFEMMITPDQFSADFDFAVYANACPCDGSTTVSCDYTGPISPPGPFVETGIASDPMASFGVPGNTEFQPTINITAGTTYYIIADNITTNGAGFTIQFGGTAGMGPPSTSGVPPPPSPVSGDIETCPGAMLPYSVPVDPTYTSYEWTVIPNTPTIDGNGDESVDVTWHDTGVYTLCVTGSTGCQESPPNCITVNVVPIITSPVNDDICLGDTYTAADGQTHFSPGVYDMNFTSYQGCDSVVQLILTLAMPSQEIFVEEICDGDSYEFEGDTYTETGVYEATYETWQGCDSVRTLNLLVVPNDAVINGSGSISCDGTPVILDGLSSLGGNNLTYEWTDESGQVLGTDPVLEVYDPGDYTLTITSEVGNNTCTDEETTTVGAANDPPENITATGDTLTCAITTVTIMGNSTSPNVTYDWTGPGGFTSGQQNPSVSVTGSYTLTVTGQNGCTGTATAEVIGDSNLPNASAEGDTLTCTAATVNLSGNSSTPGVTYAWTGPGAFSSGQQNPPVNTPGNYTLTVTAPNGCSSQSTAIVGEDTGEPDATAEGGEIDCTSPSLTLTGNSTTPNVTYAWTGPNNFSSGEQNPTASAAGTYTLTVTATNGCTATATAEVTQDANLPNVSASGGLLDCEQTTIDLSGNSTTPDVTWSWTGPGGFSSNEQNPTVSEPGTYTLTVTAVNGCTSSATAAVTQDIAPPDASAQGGTLTCTTGSVTLTGNSTTPGVSYQWTGPGGNIFNEQNPTVSQAGIYTLTVTATNGCTATATAEVIQDAGVPDVAATGDTLNCDISSVTISGSSNTAGVTYAWTGPNNFTSTETDPVVSEAGDYVLTVTAPNNCTAQATAVVFLDNEDPDIEVSGGTLSCDSTTINLSGSSATAGVTVEWTGPGGFTSNEFNPAVSAPGDYTLTLVAPNGCQSMAVATVDEDAGVPDISATGGTIDCNDSDVLLDGNSATPDVVYNWTGPGGFTATQADTVVTVPGDYTLTVTAVNGCTATQMVTVAEDLQPPADVDATGGILTCDASSLTLSGNSATPNVSFQWTGPGGFTSTEQNPSVSEAGNYLLTVTGANGCEATDQATVGQDANVPNAAAEGGTLTCDIVSIDLTGTSTSQGVSYSWTGPGGFISNDQNPAVSEPGNYTLTVMAPNGCSATASAVVAADVAEPGAEATGGTLTCTTGTLTLAGDSPTQNVTFEWSGPGGFTSADQNPEIDVQGTYVLTVTGPNGCTSSASAEVETDANTPDVTAEGGELNCNETTIILNGGSMTPGVSYSWTGPNGFTSDEEDPSTSVPGTYTLTVTASNGCTAAVDAVVTEDVEEPDVSATGGLITCQEPSIALDGGSTTPGVSYSWTGPGGYSSDQSDPVVSEGGFYTLIVTASNGCTAETTVEVELDADVPTASASGGTLTCLVNEIQLSGSANQNDVTWSWTGPGGYTSNQQNPVVNAPGNYTLTVTTMTGCSAVANAQVEEDTEAPVVDIAVPGLLTCTDETVTLDGSASDSGPDYTIEWATANGNILSGQSSLVAEVNAPGTYTLEITNLVTGCTSSQNIGVEQSNDTPAADDITASDPNCFGTNDGVIIIGTVSGGAPPYTYSLNDGPYQGEGVFTGLMPGNYTISILDDFGCELIQSVTLNQPVEVALSLHAIDFDADAERLTLGDEVTINATVTIPESQIGSIVWTPEEAMADCDDPCLSITVSPFNITTYELAVADINGCTASAEMTIQVDRSRPVFVPNAFTPNDDGINDILTVFAGPNVAEIKSFLVLSRWGETIFQYYNFQPNDPVLGWDGTHRTKKLDPGIYTWFAEVEFVDGEVLIYEGGVSLIR